MYLRISTCTRKSVLRFSINRFFASGMKLCGDIVANQVTLWFGKDGTQYLKEVGPIS